MKAEPVQTRFWRFVNKDGPIPVHRPELGPCWIWTGSKRGGQRYGAIRVGKRMEFVHRLVFLWENGRWPEPNALHRCDNGLCVRLSHIFEGTQEDNMRDCQKKGRSGIAVASRINNERRRARLVCPYGHPYTEATTYLARKKDGTTYRICRPCQARRQAEYRRRNERRTSCNG